VSFNRTNGKSPENGLTLSRDGNTLYGTTSKGGDSDHGNIFSIPITGGTATILASFNGADGNLSCGALTLSADGNTLFGTTMLGGDFQMGNVFSIPVTGGTPTVLASFNGANGQFPETGLTLSADGTTLYGTTTYGGVHNMGEIFSVPVTGGTPTVLASFNGTNGIHPEGDLTLLGNTLYGTTIGGGASDYGTVFSITLPTPEPASLALLGISATALLMRRRSRKM
jgi:uncharacterized repeat protein (TIGR03803 family)